MAMENVAGLRAGAWANVVLGVIVIAVPFFTIESVGALWNNVIVGILVVLFAGFNVWQANQARPSAVWPAGANVLLGVWLVLFPFLAATGQAFLWADVVLGILVALIAGYNAWAVSRVRAPVGARRVV